MLSSSRALFLSHMGQTSPAPMMLEVERAEGNYLYDHEGRKYFDLIAGISVAALGHNHPQVTNAVIEQIRKHAHVMVYGEFIQNPQVQYATAIAELLPKNLNGIFYTNSGAESIDAAMKLAKRVTGKTGFISHKQAYHGSSQGPLSLMGEEYYSPKYRPLLPNCFSVEQNDIEAVQQLFASQQIAGIVIEPLQAEKGCSLCSVEYLQNLRKLCDEHCALLIFDEIQTGMGRTGTWFAFEALGVVPDVLCVAKALGAGFPLGAMISDQNLLQKLANNPVLGQISTFGGHPVSCAAGLASLPIINEQLQMGNVNRIESTVIEILTDAKHVKSITGKGALLAVHLENTANCIQLIQEFLKNQIISDWFLFNTQAFRIAPALNVNVDILRTVLLQVKEILRNHKK